ncbi:uncharacterized protein LOC110686808 [Chenopodium quinoa]|uniref:uncharacterized protein LOC110686808 n=1 Tax=Chenopodium quinoa TaxID=63459 RepID=UPI000B77F448|nr:uncharacterized protein LOC110686808 [Chenopodium quinoa]
MRIKQPQDGCLTKERQEVWAKVYNARLRPGMPLQPHVLNMTRLFTHPELIGKPVDDEQAALMLLSSLYSGYVALKMQLTAKRNKLSLMDVVQELQKTYSCMKAKVALRPKKKEFKNKAKMRYIYCSRPGHYKRECSKYLEDEAKRKVTLISGIIFTLEHKPFIRRMPFGLCNAPATFQRCMMSIFGDMLEEEMEVNLVFNWEKCHFMVEEGIVLGHKNSHKGIDVDKAKIEVIEKLPPPVIVKGVRSFLAHAGFYRRFIKDFSLIAKPLNDLLQKRC